MIDPAPMTRSSGVLDAVENMLKASQTQAQQTPASVQSVVQAQPTNVASEPLSSQADPQLTQIIPQQTDPTNFAAAVPLAVDQATDTLNPSFGAGGTTAKEAPVLNVSVEKPMIDAVPGIQVVETERHQELPPEVEGFLKKVENHPEQIPDQVVITNPSTGQRTAPPLAQPVIILPITPEVEKMGERQPVTQSVRWLVEWSRKIMKIFSGKVIYRQQ